MFCNQCGAENREVMNFCVRCGAPLRTQSVQPKPETEEFVAEYIVDDAPSVARAGRARPVKPLAVAVLVIVFAAIAAFNIFKVQLNVENISIRDEQALANRIGDICETDSYIYYGCGELYRIDKSSNTMEKVGDKSIDPVVSTNKGVYGFDSDGNCYRIKDKDSEPEKYSGITKSDSNDKVLISGKYNYTVTSDGTITKKLNSDKYKNYSVKLCSGDKDSTTSLPKLYRGSIYMIREAADSSMDRHLFRMSLRTGKVEQITDDYVANFSFYGDKIVCGDYSGGLFSIDLEGGNKTEYNEVKKTEWMSFVCANGYVYYVYSGGGELHRLDIDGGSDESLGKITLLSALSEVSGGLARASNKELVVLDYDGNTVATVKP